MRLFLNAAFDASGAFESTDSVGDWGNRRDGYDPGSSLDVIDEQGLGSRHVLLG